MVIMEYFGIISEIFLRLFPFLSRFLYSKKKLSEAIVITARPQNPIGFYLSGIPRFSIYLKITNHSPFDVELDHLFVEVLIDPPHYTHLATCQSFDRLHIGRHSDGNVYCSDFLNQKQVDETRLARDKQLTFGLHITGYFDTKIGKVAKEETHIERLKAEISG